jgi:putative transcriptional regulator
MSNTFREGGEKMNKKLVARRLIVLRKDLKRSEVAKALGISYSALAMYETGQRMPKDHIKFRIANYYGLSIQEIFFEPESHVS